MASVPLRWSAQPQSVFPFCDLHCTFVCILCARVCACTRRFRGGRGTGQLNRLTLGFALEESSEVHFANQICHAHMRLHQSDLQGFESSPISWAILLFMGFIFGVALIPFAVYHAWLICRNRTTIESMEGAGRVRTSAARDPERTPVEDRLSAVAGDASLRSEDDATQALATEGPSDTDRRRKAPHSWKQDELLTKEERRALKRAGELNIYDVGVRDNWCQIMGRTWWMWFIPTGQT